jgi:hypothetical protein
MQAVTTKPCNVFGQLEAVDESICRSIDRLARVANILGVGSCGPDKPPPNPSSPEPSHLLPFTEWMYTHVQQISLLIDGIQEALGEKGPPS